MADATDAGGRRAGAAAAASASRKWSHSNTVDTRAGASPARRSIGQAQDRTHKGGAVLWYLRKNIPMPPPEESDQLKPPDLSSVLHTVAAAAGASSSAKQNFRARGKMALKSFGLEKEMQEHKLHEAFVSRVQEGSSLARKRNKKNGGVPVQARFLHDTLMSIGVEVDETRAAAASGGHPGFFSTDIAARGGCGVGRSGASTRCREDLRKQYAAHSDAECAELRRQVATKESEVEQMRRYADQLQRTLTMTRLASTRRKKRIKESRNEASGEMLQNSSTLAQNQVGFKQLLRLKEKFMSRYSAIVYDADSLRHSYANSRDFNFEEALKQRIDEQWELELEMRAALEEQTRQYQQQSIQRKAAEAALFGKHTEILQLRAQTIRTEARVTRLADDLRRLYKQVPEVVQQKMDLSAIQRFQLKEQELHSLHDSNHAAHFKWLSREQLAEQAGAFEKSEQEMSKKTKVTEELLAHGKETGKVTVEAANNIAAACNALLEAWAKLLVPLASGLLPNKDKDVVRDAAEQVQMLAKKFDLTRQVMGETLTFLLKEKPPKKAPLDAKGEDDANTTRSHRRGTAEWATAGTCRGTCMF